MNLDDKFLSKDFEGHAYLWPFLLDSYIKKPVENTVKYLWWSNFAKIING